MRPILLILLSLLIISCSNNKKIGEVKIMDESLKNDLQTIQNAKIYFGHQSVGFNIMDGVEDILKEAPEVKLNIIDIDKSNELPEGYFAHSKAGQNTQPNTKCDAFAEKLGGEFLNNTDIAFLKFCYVDMLANSDPQEVFDYYKKTMDSIKAKHPDLQLVHFTIPLTAIQTGWKATIKKLLGKEVSGHAENIKRYEYNELLKETFKDEPVFNLAKVESTYPDGSRESFTQNGKTYYSLIRNYTYDGGHLNELGRQIAAKELMKVLAEAVKNKD